VDMQRETYCQAAMAALDGLSLADLAKVVDCAIGLYDFEHQTCRSLDWIQDYVGDPDNLPDHAGRHEAGGADALAGQNIAGLRAADSPQFTNLTLTGNLYTDYLYDNGGGHVNVHDNLELQNGVDIDPLVDTGSDMGSSTARMGQVWSEYFWAYSTDSYPRYYTRAISDSHYPQIRLERARAGTAAVQSGDDLGYISWYGYTGSAYQHAVWLLAEAAENFDATHEGSRLRFGVTDNGDTAATEYMRLDGNGETIDTYKRLDIQGGTAVAGVNGITGWVDDGANFRLTFTDGIITAVANSSGGGHS